MSVPARCIAIGVLVFLYWTAAFSAAAAHKIAIFRGEENGAWRTPSWLSAPADFVGRPSLDLLRSLVGHNNLYAPGSPGCWALLLVAAASMGTGAWLMAALITGWWQRRKGPLPTSPEASR